MGTDAIGLWVIFAVTVLIVVVAIEIGHRIGLWMHRRSQDEKESSVSAIAGSILGLSAFMLAFTFSTVADRYDARKSLVRDDAVAIRTVWQRSDFLPEPDRAEAAALLRRYVDLRVTFVHASNLDSELVKGFLVETHRIQKRLWDMAVANARLDMNSDVAALYVDSLNRINEVHATRVAVGIQARVPTEIWLALYCITILGMTSMGYQSGIAGSARSIAAPILALSFALAFTLIASLDRPDSGILEIAQQPLIDLLGEMKAGQND